MKRIINDKIYDTDSAELVAEGPMVNVYRTKNGRWFEQVRSIIFDGCELHPLMFNEAKSLVGLHAPDRYDEFFGQAEEA